MVLGQSREQSSSTGFSPKGQPDNWRTTQAHCLCQTQNQRWAAAINCLTSKTLNATYLIELKMHWGLFQNGERTSLELSAFLPASQGLNVPSPVLTLYIQASENCTEKKCHTHTCRVARKLWYRTATSHTAVNISMYQLYLASIFSLAHLFVYEFLHNEIQSSFLLASLSLMQMDTSCSGKVGNLTSIFCFQNDSCQYV